MSTATTISVVGLIIAMACVGLVQMLSAIRIELQGIRHNLMEIAEPGSTEKLRKLHEESTRAVR